jgi:hypothetical protein
VTRRLQLLFLAALLGVLVALGLLAAALGGAVAVGAYAVVALGVVLVGAARARRAVSAARREAGRTCTCCTTSQFDEVTVL